MTYGTMTFGMSSMCLLLTPLVTLSSSVFVLLASTTIAITIRPPTSSLDVEVWILTRHLWMLWVTISTCSHSHPAQHTCSGG